jgi:hypothetical protein
MRRRNRTDNPPVPRPAAPEAPPPAAAHFPAGESAAAAGPSLLTRRGLLEGGNELFAGFSLRRLDGQRLTL